MGQQYTIDPDSDLDYTIDWSVWLTDGDTLSTATWTLSPSNAAVTHDPATSINTATVWIKQATASFTATCHIVTNQGRADDRTLTFTVNDL